MRGLFLPVPNPEKSRALIGCCPVQFVFAFLQYRQPIWTAHVNITILNYLAAKLIQKWEHLGEVSKMNA